MAFRVGHSRGRTWCSEEHLRDVGVSPFDLAGAAELKLLAPHGVDGIRSADRLAGKTLPRERGGRIPTPNAGLLHVHVENQIDISISIDIRQRRLNRSSFGAVSAEANGC